MNNIYGNVEENIYVSLRIDIGPTSPELNGEGKVPHIDRDTPKGFQSGADKVTYTKVIHNNT